MKVVNSSDEVLLGLLADDDESAFKELYNRYWRVIFNIAFRKIQRGDIAEELAQELFLKLWQKRKSLKIENTKAFLLTSIKNLLIDYIRHNIQEKNYLQSLKNHTERAEIPTLSKLYYNELNDALDETLTVFPKKTKEVFLLKRFENLSIKEIAFRLDLSEKAIEYHLSRSNILLKKKLNKFLLVVIAIIFDSVRL